MEPLVPLLIFIFIGLAYYQGKNDIGFRFIIEYNSLRDFGPYVIILGLFFYEYFGKMTLWIVWKLEVSY